MLDYRMAFLVLQEVPSYISDKIKNNRRRYARTNRVENMNTNQMTSLHSIFQQKKSAVFAKGVEESYDAYDKDIAVASFFFKKHTMFQYKK